MVEKIQKNIATIAFGILSLLALTTSVSACATALYQPEEPKCLRDE